MVILLIFLTTLFVGIAFLADQPNGVSNPFFSYLTVEISYLRSHVFILLFGILALTLISVRIFHFEKKYSFLKRLVFSFLKLSEITFLGFFLSFIFIIFIAFLELNLFSVLLNINPGILGVKTDKNEIVKELKKHNELPEIIAADEGKGKEIKSVAIATAGKHTMYGGSVLPSIPGFLILPVKSSPLLFIDNTLIVTSLEASHIEAISPTIGHLFLKKYFWRREIKTYPTVRIMNNEEYIKNRVDDAQEKLIQIDQQLADIDDTISSLSARIVVLEGELESQQALATRTDDQVNLEYQRCLAAKNPISFCRNQKNQIETSIKESKDTAENTTVELEFGREQLESYTFYKRFYSSQKILVQSLKGKFTHELGVFKPEKDIRIVFIDSDRRYRVADYFATLVHEYLHYASYVSKDKKFSDAFFEEGVTEYFTRQIIKDTVGEDTNLGYPVQAKIIAHITNSILEADLADMYFTKDQEGLVHELDQIYGENFYRDTRVLFESLQLSSNPQQMLRLANDIMKRIDGTPFKAEDLMSNY